TSFARDWSSDVCSSDLAFGRDGPFAIASELNEAIAVGDWTLYTTFLDRIERVTPEAVRDVARRVFVRVAVTVGLFDPILPETARSEERRARTHARDRPP